MSPASIRRSRCSDGAGRRRSSPARQPCTGSRWFQVYLLADPGARSALVERAVEHGYEALAMTVDLQRLGRRERDIRLGFELPFDVSVPNVAMAAASSLDEAAEQSLVESVTW